MLAVVGAVGCNALELSNGAFMPEAKPGDEQRAERLHQRGVQLVKQGRLEKAEAAFHNALLSDESHGPAHNNIGLLYYGKGDLYSAAWSFERAIESLPERPEPVNNLGMTLEAAGRLHEAVEMYQTAWSLEPSNPEFLGNLVRAKLRRGDRDYSVLEELQELVFIETRPEWRVFAQQQLTMLSRVTEDDLEDLDATDRPNGATNEGEAEAIPVPAPLSAPSNGGLLLPSRARVLHYSDAPAVP